MSKHPIELDPALILGALGGTATKLLMGAKAPVFGQSTGTTPSSPMPTLFGPEKTLLAGQTAPAAGQAERDAGVATA